MKKQTNKQNDAAARTTLIHWKKNRNISSWKWVKDMAKIKVMKYSKTTTQTANKKTKKDDDEGTLNK